MFCDNGNDNHVLLVKIVNNNTKKQTLEIGYGFITIEVKIVFRC